MIVTLPATRTHFNLILNAISRILNALHLICIPRPQRLGHTIQNAAVIEQVFSHQVVSKLETTERVFQQSELLLGIQQFLF